MTQDSGDENTVRVDVSGDGTTSGDSLQPERKIAKTLLFSNSPELKKIRKLLAGEPKSNAAELVRDGAEVVRESAKTFMDMPMPPQLPPQPARRVARTLLEIQVPDLDVVQVADVKDPGVQLPELTIPFIDRVEIRQHFVAKTRLDQSVLAETVLKFEKRKEARAAEEAKERASRPPIEFHPVDSKRLARSCAWKWDDDDSNDKFRYCPNCKLQAYNFDGMELPAAEALIFTRENIKTPTLFKRADGKFMTQDCPVQVKKRHRIILTSIVSASFILALLAMLVLMPHPALSPKTLDNDSEDDSNTVAGAAAEPEHAGVYDEKPVYVHGADGKLKRLRPTFGPEDKKAYWE